MWTGMKDTLSDIMKTVNDMMPVIAPVLRFVGSTIGAILKAVWDIGKAIAVIAGPGFMAAVGAFTLLLVPVKWLAQLISWIINLVFDLGIAFGKFVMSLSWVKNFIADIKIIFVLVKLWIESVLNSIKITLNSIKQDFKDFFSDLFTFGDYDIKEREQRRKELDEKTKGMKQYAFGTPRDIHGNIITNNKAITYSNADNSYRVMNISFPTKAAAQEYDRTGKMSGMP